MDRRRWRRSDRQRICRRPHRYFPNNADRFGGARSGTDAAKLVGLGVNAIGYGVAVALALGGEITPTGMRFAPDRTDSFEGRLWRENPESRAMQGLSASGLEAMMRRVRALRSVWGPVAMRQWTEATRSWSNSTRECMPAPCWRDASTCHALCATVGATLVK